jgi:hypothetical protein
MRLFRPLVTFPFDFLLLLDYSCLRSLKKKNKPFRAKVKS